MQGSAPVYSIADEAHARAEAAAWSRFTAPADADEFCTSWLACCARASSAAARRCCWSARRSTGPTASARSGPIRRRDLQYLGPAGAACADRARRCGHCRTCGRAGRRSAVAGGVSGRGRRAAVGRGRARARAQRRRRTPARAAQHPLGHRLAGRSFPPAPAGRARGRAGACRPAQRPDGHRAAARPAASRRRWRWPTSSRSACNATASASGLERHGRITPLALSHTATFDAPLGPRALARRCDGRGARPRRAGAPSADSGRRPRRHRACARWRAS